MLCQQLISTRNKSIPIDSKTLTAPPTRVQSKVINVLKKLGYTRSKHPKLGRVWKIMPGHGGLGPPDDPEELF